ncbi:hypothetical protein DL346_22480 [Paenibacillus montanisoli]|uniref:Uncharacterized protein n=1 Tax=Paenibacillus montanisoli TaxID=2081970 RepID=A0A328TWC7_9BACL|nr:hypothetical protein DL346_22480 [Paenibacillus montanisoli]
MQTANEEAIAANEGKGASERRFGTMMPCPASIIYFSVGISFLEGHYQWSVELRIWNPAPCLQHEKKSPTA